MANVSSSNGLEKRPKLRFPGFDEPYKHITLGEIASLVNRTDPKADAPIMMLSAGNGFIMQSEKYSRDNAGQSLKKYILLKQGELAYNHGASKAKQYGCCYELTEKEARIPYVYHCFKISETEYTPYIAMALNNSKMDKQLKRLVSSSVRMDGLLNISFEDYMSVTLFVPSSKEQKHIADFINRLDERIKAQEKLVASLKKYKRGVMSILLSSKDNPYYSSETWKEVSLSDVASGFEYGMNAAATVYDGSHKYIRITDIDDSSHLYSQDEPVSPEGQAEEKYRVRENDILFARTGASVGKSYCYQRSDGDLYFAGFLVRIHVNSGVDCSYVFQNTMTEAYRRWVMLESARSGQPGINAEQYKQYRFLLPPIETQKKISLMASNLDALISKGERLQSQLEQIKAALMQQLFI